MIYILFIYVHVYYTYVYIYNIYVYTHIHTRTCHHFGPLMAETYTNMALYKKRPDNVSRLQTYTHICAYIRTLHAHRLKKLSNTVLTLYTRTCVHLQIAISTLLALVHKLVYTFAYRICTGYN